MLAATGFTPLLVDLESVSPKPKGGMNSKYGVTWKAEKAMQYFAHIGKVIAVLLRTGELPHVGSGAVP